jgi:hypothetical protein
LAVIGSRWTRVEETVKVAKVEVRARIGRAPKDVDAYSITVDTA